MPVRPEFTPLQAQLVNEAFQQAGVEFLFIGKSGAILLGYPSTTQDVDVFVPKSGTNARKIIRALRALGFVVSRKLATALRSGKDFVQIKSGPFDLDIIHAPDGIESFEEAKSRSLEYAGYPIASLRDIIASKRASNRAKDQIDLEMLEDFRKEFERHNSPPIRSAIDALLSRAKPKQSRRKQT